MTKIENIQYSEAAGDAGYGDLYLPTGIEHPRPILLIHGGAWKWMDRFRVQKVAEFLCLEGYAVFNIDYRLTPTAVYPACADDCLAAARFLLKAGHPAMKPLDRRNLVVGGLSAGGHLALVAGLQLPRERVAGIIDISGPTDLNAPEVADLVKSSMLFKGHADPQASRIAASPTTMAQGREDLPPLLVLNNENDQIVPVEQAMRIIQVWNEARADLQVFLYAGKSGMTHDIWRDGSEFPQLHEKLEAQIRVFLDTFFAQ